MTKFRSRAMWAAVMALGMMLSRAWANDPVYCYMNCYVCGSGGNSFGICCEKIGDCPCDCVGDDPYCNAETSCSDYIDATMSAGSETTYPYYCDPGCAESCCGEDYGGGGGGGTCTGSTVYFWSFAGVWVTWAGGCSGECSSSPEGPGCSVGQSVVCPCGGPCPVPDCPTDPCEGHGGDADNDGCCADVDENDGNSSYCTTEPPACEEHGGDADNDGCCADVDVDDGDSGKCTESLENEEGCGGPCMWEPVFNTEGEFVQWQQVGASYCKEGCECQEPEGEGRVPKETPCEKEKTDCECSDLFSTRVAAMRARLIQWWPSLDQSYSFGASSWTIEIPYLSSQTIVLTINTDPTTWGFGMGTAAEWLRSWVWSWSFVMLVWLVTSAVVKDLSNF